MENQVIYRNLKKKIAQLTDNKARVQYLEQYLEQNPTINWELRALISEHLYTLVPPRQQKKGLWAQHTAAAWEMAAVLKDNTDNTHSHYQKKTYKRSLRYYRIAGRTYAKQNSYYLSQKAAQKATNVRTELRQLSSPLHTIAILFIIGLFILSFFFLSSPTTGLAIAPINDETSGTLGIILTIIAISGAVLLYIRLFK